MNKNAIVIILVMAVVIVGGYFLFNKKEVQAPVSTIEPGMKVFTDKNNTLSFSYPEDLVFSSGGDTWKVNTLIPGEMFAKVSIPRTTQPNTNFSEAWFTAGSSSDNTAINECLIATNGEVSKGRVTINGVSYFVTELMDAGMGNFYNTTSYKTLRNNQCYVLEYTVHSTNIDNYSPDQGITKFDNAKVIDVLEGMVHSVKFL